MKIYRFMPYCALILLVTFSSAGCANKAEEKPNDKKSENNGRRIVGRIASIPSDRKFVLIQSYGTWKIETGTILTTQGPDSRAANLRVTGEKLGQYAAADIQSGALEIGDGVYTVATVPQKQTVPEETLIIPAEVEGAE